MTRVGAWECLCGISGTGDEQLRAHINEHDQIKAEIRAQGYDMYWRRNFGHNLNFTVRLTRNDKESA